MQIEPTWWITAIEAPVVAALFWMIHSLRRDLLDRIDRTEERRGEMMDRTREDLAAFKIEVASGYVPQPVVREVDRRLSAHLLRIEAKLDATLHAADARPARHARLAVLPLPGEDG